ncbi:MAG: Sua5/YciO/YrdC/YwlC family protein, partial [Candidatus Levybacteria bacterium]|nr:Sua5/YciO/YrdC/YwlC family protein [Candidatus Levybacteria bacterium]
RGGTETLGVRMPNHPRLLSLIERVGVPILCPSANFHGGKTPYKTWDLDPFLVSQVDYILKEDATGLKASTVIDCTKNPWKVIRPGAIDITV